MDDGLFIAAVLLIAIITVRFSMVSTNRSLKWNFEMEFGLAENS